MAEKNGLAGANEVGRQGAGHGAAFRWASPTEPGSTGAVSVCARANQTYGALTAEFYIAGFTFERAMARVLGLLKDGGWAKVGDGFDDVNAFVRGLPLDQFKVVTEQRKEFVERVRELQPAVSNRAIADALGVHHDTIDRAAAGGNPPRGDRKGQQNGKTSGGNPPDGAPYFRTNFTGDVEWYTPVEHIERARRALGAIDLDPASSRLAQGRVKAARYFTIEDDGLTHPWHGRVFLNPPYAQPAIELFIDKLLEELAAGHTTAAILLTNNSTDTAWFAKAALAAPLIGFTRGRIPFESPTRGAGAPVQGQAFMHFGANGDSFAREFGEICFIRGPSP